MTVMQAQPTEPQSQPRAVERKLLLITSMAGAASCAAGLQTQLKSAVHTVATRREGLTALRGHDYSAVIVDDAITESDPAGAELIRKHAGLAVVLEVNFAIAGVARIGREIRSELLRRERERGVAMRLASTAIESELRSTVAGLLLQTQLALAEPEISPSLSSKLRQVVELAGSLRQRLERPSDSIPRA